MVSQKVHSLVDLLLFTKRIFSRLFFLISTFFYVQRDFNGFIERLDSWIFFLTRNLPAFFLISTIFYIQRVFNGFIERLEGYIPSFLREWPFLGDFTYLKTYGGEKALFKNQLFLYTLYESYWVLSFTKKVFVFLNHKN